MVSKKVSRVSLPSLLPFLPPSSCLLFLPWVFLEVEATRNSLLPTWLLVNFFLLWQHTMNQYTRWLQFLDLRIQRRRDAQRARASAKIKTQHQRDAKNRVDSIGHSWQWLNSPCSRIWRRDWQLTRDVESVKTTRVRPHTPEGLCFAGGSLDVPALQIERQMTDYQVFKASKKRTV